MYVQNFLGNLTVKEFWKLVYTCRLRKLWSSVKFWDRVYLRNVYRWLLYTTYIPLIGLLQLQHAWT